jgi:F0F1-type ATP synthase membrane subunit c/vacuolar-type H+-ATPase subunit K
VSSQCKEIGVQSEKMSAVSAAIICGVTGIVVGMGIGVLVSKIKGAASVGASEQVNISEVKITEF